MNQISFIATIIENSRVEVSLCDVIPDIVHMVKYVQAENAVIYYSADVDWTPDLEETVFEQVMQDFRLIPAM